MDSIPNAPEQKSAGPKVVLAATFTADPIAESLNFLLSESGLGLETELAPYGQAFQLLLDSTGAFARNRDGVNVLLLRFEDWLRSADGFANDPMEHRRALERNVEDLTLALRSSVDTTDSPLVLALCPASPALVGRAEVSILFRALEETLRSRLEGLANLHILSVDQGSDVTVDVIHDQEGDRLGHVPYTRHFFVELGRALARLIHGLKRTPAKVIVLDCDNTLWKGVVGEDGTAGVEITPEFAAIQRFVLEKKESGMLLCIASKNDEIDVLRVFGERHDMLLKLDDIVSTRINWLPKSENIASLAAELKLGVDSFVLIDDNPVECAEVESGCPGILTLQLPSGDGALGFLRNVWPLDLLERTEEDRRRNDMYRQNLARERIAASSASLSSFLASLELKIAVLSPSTEQLARVAQLTQRTNQFNCTTRRRKEAEVANLEREGMLLRVVHVEDRFGDYGLVGVMIAAAVESSLVLDTFLLSCRALGRGVEHAMVRELGSVAGSLKLARIEIPFIPSQKNGPARRFLESITVAKREEIAGGLRFTVSAEDASALVYCPAQVAVDMAVHEETRPAHPRETTVSRSVTWNRIARLLSTPDALLAALDEKSNRHRAPLRALVPARTGTERKLCGIWSDVLGIAAVGVEDDYVDDLGGTSLAAVTIFARIERELGVRFPLSALVEFPTVARLSSAIKDRTDMPSLVSLRSNGKDVPLFLVHDADGEILLYRNLAKRLHTRPVYALQPKGTSQVPIAHTRISEMAAYYVSEIRRIRPHGPYLLGGLCAGGVVAYEIALQLEDAGETARLVALFDAADVEAERKPQIENRRRLARLRDVLKQEPLDRGVGSVLKKARGYIAYQAMSSVRRARERLAVRSLRVCLDLRLPIVPWARGLRVRSVYLVAEDEYRPHRPLRGEIVLFRASEGKEADEPYVQLYRDPLLGWSKRSLCGVRAFDVPGGHGSMLQEPHVDVVASMLSDYLERSDEKGGPVNIAGAVRGSQS